MGSKVTWNPDLRGPDYKPFVTVLLPSQGKVSRLAGHTTGREHHVLSSLELDWWYLYDWRPEEIDIREQYAMPVAPRPWRSRVSSTSCIPPIINQASRSR